MRPLVRLFYRLSDTKTIEATLTAGGISNYFTHEKIMDKPIYSNTAPQYVKDDLEKIRQTLGYPEEVK